MLFYVVDRALQVKSKTVRYPKQRAAAATQSVHDNKINNVIIYMWSNFILKINEVNTKMHRKRPVEPRICFL